MASGRLVRRLIKSGTEGNLGAFLKASEEVIREERAKQHHLLANDLEKILYGCSSEPDPYCYSVGQQVPRDRERDLPLLHVAEPIRRKEDVVLSGENASLIEEILQEHHRSDLIRSVGLRPVDKLLFCGPPGCGKTITAEVLAHELSLPLAIVRIDCVMSSYLGETASNLRQVFDFVSGFPMVVLFDEFDALAKERADDADHGELKRVVNAFLQMLDGYRGKSVLIAATNHETMLDSAVWRRFDDLLAFEPPNRRQIAKLLQVKLRGIRREFEIDDSKIIDLFVHLSHADIERIILRAIKGMVLSRKSFLNERHLHVSILREKQRKVRAHRI